MKAAGEKYAKDQLKQARLEDKPRLLPVYDIGEFIELVEEQVWKSNTGKSLKVNRKNTKEVSIIIYLFNKVAQANHNMTDLPASISSISIFSATSWLRCTRTQPCSETAAPIYIAAVAP